MSPARFDRPQPTGSKPRLTEYDGAKFEAKTEAEAHAVRDALQSAALQVSKVDETEKLDKAEPPFKTSSSSSRARSGCGSRARKP